MRTTDRTDRKPLSAHRLLAALFLAAPLLAAPSLASAATPGTTPPPAAAPSGATDRKPAESAAPSKPAPATAPTTKGGTQRADAKAPEKGGSSAAAATAPSTETPEQEAQRLLAKTAYAAGNEAYAKDDFAAALDSFQKADAALPSPHAKFWTAQCLYRLPGREEEALAAYVRFLGDEGAARVGEASVAEATARHDELRAKLRMQVTLRVRPEGASVTLDGAPVTTATAPLWLTAGPHELTVSAEGYLTQTIKLDAQAGTVQSPNVELRLVPPPAPPPAAPVPPPPPAEPDRTAGWVTLGVAGAAAVTGTVFGVLALQGKSDFEKDPTTKTADEVERNALIADMAFGVAITLGVTSIVLLTADPPKDAAPTTTAATRRTVDLAVAPYAGPTGAGAAARLRF